VFFALSNSGFNHPFSLFALLAPRFFDTAHLVTIPARQYLGGLVVGIWGDFLKHQTKSSVFYFLTNPHSFV
jgi:hypothetical protein